MNMRVTLKNWRKMGRAILGVLRCKTILMICQDWMVCLLRIAMCLVWWCWWWARAHCLSTWSNLCCWSVASIVGAKASVFRYIRYKEYILERFCSQEWAYIGFQYKRKQIWENTDFECLLQSWFFTLKEDWWVVLGLNQYHHLSSGLWRWQ